MTLLGKVFMFSVLLLSGIFFSLALAVNASHTKWREAVTAPNGYQAQIKKMEATITELKAAIEKASNELAIEQAARRIALASLQTQLSEQQGELEKKESDLLELQRTRRLQDDTLSRTSQDLERVTAENSEIKKLIDQTIQDRNSQRAKVIELTDTYNSLQSIFSDAQTQAKELENQNSLLEARANIMRSTLNKAGLNEDLDDAPPEGLRGLILKVGRDNLVEVSLGRDDGVKVDHEFEVSRGSSYLGKIRIMKVEDDKAIGIILPAYRRGLIQQGDKIAAKLG
jgi:hypothetical protein